jgi:HlyD family secretion protein
VQMLAAGGALIRADVELDTDANSPSGFKWSSSKGPPMQMSNGTLFFASLVIGEQRPISLVLPVLK